MSRYNNLTAYRFSVLHHLQGIWRKQTLNSELQRPRYTMSLWSRVSEIWMMRVWQPLSFENSTIAPTNIHTGYYIWCSPSMDKNGSFWVTSTKSEPDVLIQHTGVCFKLKENYQLSNQNYVNENATLILKVNWPLKICFILAFDLTQRSQTTKNKTHKNKNPKPKQHQQNLPYHCFNKWKLSVLLHIIPKLLGIYALNSHKLVCGTMNSGVQSSSLHLNTNMSCFTWHNTFINQSRYKEELP